MADSGLLTRTAAVAGVDFLLVLSAGFYRNQGVRTAAAETASAHWTDQVAVDVGATRRQKLLQALLNAGGNKCRAAALLGITRKTLYAWLKELDAVKGA